MPRGAVPLLLVGLAIIGGLWFGRRSPQPIPTAAVVLEGPSMVAGPVITVHVAGAVVEPGLVVVDAEARVADVIAAAGGARPGARLDALNLAAPVRDGEQIVVPASSSRLEAAVAQSDGRVRVNVATASELETLPGVGPVLALRIAAYRDANGLFETVEDLLDVPGIGELKVARPGGRAITSRCAVSNAASQARLGARWGRERGEMLRNGARS